MKFKLPKVFKSARFYAVVYIALVELLFALGLEVEVLNEILRTLQLIAGGSALIRTVDRHGEK